MEYRRRCNVCGKIYCFSDKDLKDNTTNSTMAAISAVGAIASIFGGTRLDTYALNSQGDRYSDKVVDYFKCPNCNSTSTSLVIDTEWLEMQQKETAAVQTQVIQTKKIDINSNATSDSLLKRTKMFLEEEDWDSASAYCEQILDIDPECAMAYVYKLMIELKVTEQDKLALLAEPFTEDKLYQKAIRFADGSLRSTLEGYNYAIIERNNERDYSSALTAYNKAKTEQDCKALIPRFQALGDYKNSMQMVHECEEKAVLCKYSHAVQLQQRAKTEKEFLEAKAEFDSISSFSDASILASVCREKAEEARKNAIYDEAVSSAGSYTIMTVENAVKEFEKIPGWRDADQKKIEALNRVDQLKKAEKKAANKKKIIYILSVSAVVVCIVIVLIAIQVIKNNKYNSANEKYASGDYIAAIQIWTELEDYKDSPDRIQDCVINICDEVLVLIDEGNYEKAKETLTQVKSYVGAESNNVYEVFTGWLILIDCIDIIEAGGSINLTDIYDRIAELPPEVDCAKFYDLDLIKQVEYLGTTWKLQTALCNGKRNELYEQDYYGYSFEGGKFIHLDKNGAENTSWDLYYTNGIFSAGSHVSGDSYRIITQFDGVGDITINVKHVFDSSYDGTHYEWNETLNRQ